MAEPINNREKRIEMLKEIISGLHEGKAEEEVRGQLKELVQRTDASEIAAMEQELIDDGLPVEKVMAMCDLHSQVVSEILVSRPGDPVVPGHPVDSFKKENAAIREEVQGFRAALAEALSGGDEETVELGDLQGRFNGLMDIEKHYSRKENLLFPVLERHGVTGPSKVMWGKDDEVRGLLKGLGEALGAGEASVGEWKIVNEAVVEPALAAIEEMVRKEEDILLPMALDALTAAEWGEIWEQTPEIGYCLVEPGDEYELPGVAPGLLDIEGGEPTKSGGETLITPTGALSFEQLKGIFSVLPVDVTFVDADDRVRFFSEGAKRVFPRPKTIIGRKVQHCHPPASVDIVEKIVSDFRSGVEDSCSFWIEFQGKFVYIRYFAVRDGQGEYQGTVEVTQDLTEERQLEGERRLLEYDS
jgi:uncharacterized protein